eukprot:2016055-Rhodomonas_salina.1
MAHAQLRVKSGEGKSRGRVEAKEGIRDLDGVVLERAHPVHRELLLLLPQPRHHTPCSWTECGRD